MMAEQATVFAVGPSAGSHFKAAVAGLAFGTDDIGRPHVWEITTRCQKFQLGQPDGGPLWIIFPSPSARARPADPIAVSRRR
jgi:hypothetical protein